MIWDTERILADFGFIQIRWYTIWFVTGLLCVWHIGASAYERRNMPRSYVPQFIMLFTVGIVVGGHIFHIIFYEPKALIENPKRLLQFGQGMASHGSFLGILAFLSIWCRIKKVSFRRVCDASAVAWFWLFPFVRIGNFFNSEIYGKVTEVPWGIVFEQAAAAGLQPRHPVQLYEALFNFFLIWFAYKTDKDPDQFAPGVRAAALIGLYCVGRFFLEFFKEYQILDSGSWLNMGQIWSIIGFGLCAATAYLLARSPQESVSKTV